MDLKAKMRQDTGAYGGTQKDPLRRERLGKGLLLTPPSLPPRSVAHHSLTHARTHARTNLLTPSITHSLTYSLARSFARSFAHSPSHSRSFAHSPSPHSLPPLSLPRSFTHSLPHSFARALVHSTVWPPRHKSEDTFGTTLFFQDRKHVYFIHTETYEARSY